MSKRPSLSTRLFQYGVLIVAALFAFYPVWFAMLASFRTGDRLYALDLLGMFVPTEFTLENYRVMLFDRPLLLWLRNSFYVAGLTTVVSLLVSTSAAFAFSRLRFPGRQFGLTFMLAIQTFPAVLALVAVAQVLTAVGLFGKHEGLVLAFTAGTLVFCTWNMKGYFDTIPVDLEEAAMLDGCGPVQAFIYVALPLARPALAVTALMAFLSGWGDYIFSSVLIPAPDSMKLAVAGLFSMAGSQSVPWGYFAAGAMIVILPTVVLFLVLQRMLVAGLTAGAVK